jgi:NADH:ubiquinone oxidoreductase subunit E
MQKELDLKEGETSSDYQFTLETVACLGACFAADNHCGGRVDDHLQRH